MSQERRDRLKQEKKGKGRSRTRRFFTRALIVIFILGLAVSGGVFAALFTVYRQLPDVGQLENYTLPMATEIYTANKTLLTRISSQGRYDPIALQELPKHVQDAVVSAEDGRF